MATQLLSRTQVAELAQANPALALARCEEVLSRQSIRDTKREAWKRLADFIRASIPKEVKPEAVKPAKPEKVAKVKAKPVKPVKSVKPAKPVKAEKGCWQVEGDTGSVIVPYTTKSVKGLFGGEAVTLSDETWRYLSRPIAPGGKYYLTDPGDALYAHYIERGHSPHINSVKGSGHRGLAALALDPQGEE